MTWLAWRQFRAGALFAAALVLGVAVVLVATHPQVDAVQDVDALTSWVRNMRLLGTVLIGVPAFLGAFWGAPLVAHELETGTHRLVWTQSVTRTRWLATRLAVVTIWAVVVTGVFSAAFTWWSQSLDQFGNRIGTANFAQRGLVPPAYAVFAIALGVLLGAVLKRTLPAMALTLVGFGLVRFAFQRWVRVHLLGTTQLSTPTSYFGARSGTGGTGGWILSTRMADRHGHILSAAQVEQLVRRSCTITRGTTAKSLARCADRIGVHDVVKLHPASQFWALQAIEALCFFVLAGALAVVAVWWVRRRLV
jgi:hypothetical protein